MTSCSIERMSSILLTSARDDVGAASRRFDSSAALPAVFRACGSPEPLRRPSARRRGRTSRPMPSLAPVMTARRPSRRKEGKRHASPDLSSLHGYGAVIGNPQTSAYYLVRPVVVSSGCSSFTRRSSNGYVV